MSAVRHIEIGEAEADQRFDRWAKKHFPQIGHVQLQKLLRSGQFRLDGKRVKASDRVQAGQSVRVPPIGAAPPVRRTTPNEADARLVRSMVIHEDEEVIVLNKPTGLAVQGGTKTARHIDGMLAALAHRGETPRLVHRLDRDTSGILVLARTAAVARRLMHAFQQHEIKKLYWAVVLGKPERDSGLIDLPLGKAGRHGAERMTAHAPGARHAQTDFRVIARAGKVGAWAGLMPLTGRTHQLRAHMAAVGTPILGDAKYGAEKPSTAPPGLMLHASEILLPLSSRRQLAIKAEPPGHLVAGLSWLGIVAESQRYSRIADWDEER